MGRSDDARARGLVVDRAAGRVVATPFPKFFNYGERGGLDLPDEPFDAFEKVDGSLGVAFHDAGRWRVATKGAFSAAQSTWAEAWLAARDAAGLVPGATYLFEIVYAANRIVVRYDAEALVLLGAYDANGVEPAWAEVEAAAARLGTRACRRVPFASVAQIVEAARLLDVSAEGFVARFASGLRVKVKGAEYLRIHRLLTRVTPLGLWEAMHAAADLDAMRRDVPEEFWPDFDRIRVLLAARFDALVAEVDATVARHAAEDDKTLGVQLATLPESVRRHVFAARRDGPDWHRRPRAREALLRQLRPRNDELPGYVPSEAARRVEEDGA